MGGGLQSRGKWGSILNKNVLVVFVFFTCDWFGNPRACFSHVFVSFFFFVFLCVVCKAQSAKKRAKIFGAWVGFDKMEYGVGVCGQTDDLIR